MRETRKEELKQLPSQSGDTRIVCVSRVFFSHLHQFVSLAINFAVCLGMRCFVFGISLRREQEISSNARSPAIWMMGKSFVMCVIDVRLLQATSVVDKKNSAWYYFTFSIRQKKRLPHDGKWKYLSSAKMAPLDVDTFRPNPAGRHANDMHNGTANIGKRFPARNAFITTPIYLIMIYEKFRSILLGRQ